MKKLICKLFGHKWGEWETLPGVLWTLPGEEHRQCSRCKSVDVRCDFDTKFAVGSTIQIRMPQKYAMRDSERR